MAVIDAVSGTSNLTELTLTVPSRDGPRILAAIDKMVLEIAKKTRFVADL
jgi:hypothetical protein